jgi:murein DD-endopeptidase MepM/ murein hydrolase activator NlpD
LLNIKYNYEINYDKLKKNKNIINIDKNRVLTVLSAKKIEYPSKNKKNSINKNNKLLLEFNHLKYNGTKVKNKNIDKIAFMKHISVYQGILFIFIFCFLFFMTISISFASPLKKQAENDAIYINANSLDLIKNSLITENQHSKDDKNVFNFKKIEISKYKVNNNETIKSIAKKFNLSEDTIILTNKISSNNILKQGMLLNIPNQNGRLITLGNNDSIYKIAEKYGISWEKIVDVNSIESNIVYSGTKIFIPESKLSNYEKTQFYDIIQFKWPLKGKISSYFGFRIDPFTLTYGYHTGLDIGSEYGTPVKSINDGTVIYTGYDDIYGNNIIIKHSDGIISKYGHLSKILVSKDEKVKISQLIANVGSTGRSTGSHLHLEIRKNGKLIDPLKLLK